MILSRDIGIDLGTATTMICDRKGRIIVREPSVVAVDVKTKRVVATGTQAKQMIGRTPGSIVAVRPLKNGVIADFDMTADMLHSFIFRSDKRSMFSKTRVVISVPSGVTEVERRAVEDAVRSAGAQDVELIDEPMAAALGAGLPVYEPTGSMIVDIGGGTTDVAVISLGGMVESTSIKVAGDKFDDAIVKYVRRKHNVLIGERTAEELKMTIGCVYPREEEVSMEVKGRCLMTGLPRVFTVTSTELLEAFEEVSTKIVEAVHFVLERTAPELVGDIATNGIVMTGGGSLIYGFDKLIESKTGIATRVADDAISCVALGTGKTLDNLSVMQDGTMNLSWRRQMM